MRLIINLLVNALAVFICAFFLPGVYLAGFVDAIWVALALALLNTFIKPILMVLSFPINFITLGLFTIVINTVIIMTADYFVPGFNLASFWIAVLFSLVLAIVSSILETLSGSKD